MIRNSPSWSQIVPEMRLLGSLSSPQRAEQLANLKGTVARRQFVGRSPQPRPHCPDSSEEVDPTRRTSTDGGFDISPM